MRDCMTVGDGWERVERVVDSKEDRRVRGMVEAILSVGNQRSGIKSSREVRGLMENMAHTWDLACRDRTLWQENQARRGGQGESIEVLLFASRSVAVSRVAGSNWGEAETRCRAAVAEMISEKTSVNISLSSQFPFSDDQQVS